MKRICAFIIAACVLISGKPAWAHRIDEYLQATILALEAHDVQASMRLIPGVLTAPSVIAAIDINHDGVFSASEKQAYAHIVLSALSITIDGNGVRPDLESWTFPEPAQMREGLGEIQIAYRVVLPQGGSARALVVSNNYLPSNSVYLMNAVVPQDHNLCILAQKRNERQSRYEVDYQQRSGADKASVSASSWFLAWLSSVQFASLFRLGMQHIAEGTDHLLFLLVLLLPAPLLATGARWGWPADVHRSLMRILSIVTAFTLGHSLTLGLAAMGLVHVPEQPVEVLIAVSILVSAIHALRPIFPGREAWVAAFFGLIHGLAFAATLDRLGLSRWDRIAGILAFNLGIETMQMIVVIIVLPSLMLMSRSLAYPFVRIGGALFASVAAVCWIAERLLNLKTPVNMIVTLLTTNSLRTALALFLVSLACWSVPARRAG